MFSQLTNTFATSALSLMGKMDNRVSLITGGTSGLGLSSAEMLWGEGSAVVFAARKSRKEIDEKIAKMNEERPNSAMFVKLDAANETDWKNAMKTIEKKFKKLNVCVNNAGIGDDGDIEAATLEGFKKTQAINTEGVFLGSKYSIELMKKNPKENCSIINMSSIEGLIGFAPITAYTASKGAVRIMSKSIALHCAKKGYKIRCNTIHPGVIETPILGENIDPAIKKYYESLHPMGRIGRPEEIGSVVVFLASDDSSFMTGSEVVVDGGYTCQ